MKMKSNAWRLSRRTSLVTLTNAVCRSPVMRTHRAAALQPVWLLQFCSPLHLHSRHSTDGTRLDINDSRGPHGTGWGNSGTSAVTPASHLSLLEATRAHSSESAFSLRVFSLICYVMRFCFPCRPLLKRQYQCSQAVLTP